MRTAITPRIRRGATIATEPAAAAAELYEAIHQPDTSVAVFFCSPDYDLDQLGPELAQRFEGINLIGCTTAGEITPEGYLSGAITGASLVSPDFKAVTRRLDNVSDFRLRDGETMTCDLLAEMTDRGIEPSSKDTFAFLLVDGLCCQEESIVSSLYRGLPNLPLFGGSAGDATNFQSTFVYHDGRFHQDAAVFTVVQTSFPFTVFKTQHFVSSDTKMVITGADPGRRIVSEINGVPAGREYARLVGLDIDKLTPMIFASHPVVVKIGGLQYVRSIQKVNPDESLTFFCAIDEGLVLTVARGVDFVDTLKARFASIREEIGEPEFVLGCDCILRNLELDERGIREEVGRILAENNVIGFGTYGEQYNAVHVNQTLTGVAIGARQ
ncbi:nitric oxide-sensing protein NosP [Candidatus Eisenbacteria bacterium]|uniref:Nitric oxide-sensing protein NosP n=1 Tax=Eiseniibacteriota bacterium TaxID=2212470 RepID=A0ABV6YMH8_UNCEI